VTLYADTSVLVAFVFNEPESNRVRRWFRRTMQRIVVSDLARLEFPAVVTTLDVRLAEAARGQGVEVAALG
jgi:predicted nucleic acid-binding protein